MLTTRSIRNVLWNYTLIRANIFLEKLCTSLKETWREKFVFWFRTFSHEINHSYARMVRYILAHSVPSKCLFSSKILFDLTLKKWKRTYNKRLFIWGRSSSWKKTAFSSHMFNVCKIKAKSFQEKERLQKNKNILMSLSYLSSFMFFSSLKR